MGDFSCKNKNYNKYFTFQIVFLGPPGTDSALRLPVIRRRRGGAKHFKRPSGTQILWMANPAINRRATIACPSGTKLRLDSGKS
jgi:hypothetical protein